MIDNDCFYIYYMIDYKLNLMIENEIEWQWTEKIHLRLKMNHHNSVL